jgi:hypothetical protein
MTDTIFTSQTPGFDQADPGTTRSIGMRFTCSASGRQVNSGRTWVPSTGLAATAWWQLWDMTGTPTLLDEVDLHTLPTPANGAWMAVPIAAPIPLTMSTQYVVTLFCSAGTDHYVFSAGATLPIGSGGTISADTAIYRDNGAQTDPPNNTGFSGGLFFSDVDVDTAAAIVNVGIASEQDHAVAAGSTIFGDAGIASEQDHAVAAGSTVLANAGIASEQDHAVAAGSTVVANAGIASEQDHAVAAGSTVTASVGIVSEQDFAQGAGATVSANAGAASEQDHALPVGATVIVNVGIASEQDFALSAGGALIEDAGAASEQDHALPVGATVIVNVGIASEQDFALNADDSTIVVNVGIATEQDHAQPVMARTPGVPQLAHLIWAIARLLRDCLCAKLLETTGGPVCRCSLMGGDQAIADICEKTIMGDGQAWVRMTRLFVTNEFPRPMTDTFNCAGGLWVAEFELGVLRCAVTSDAQGQPPGAEELNAEVAKVMDDAFALRITAECCLPAALPSIPGEWQPMSGGACTGGRVTVMVYLVPGPYDLIPQIPVSP